MKCSSLYCTIEKAIEYVENNLKAIITLEDISNHVNMSKFHLNRMFHELTKTTLMHYVKTRKLSNSAIELINTSLRISDIAQEYGFNYEQSYIRSFENTFGISPDRFRKEKPSLNIKDKINLDYIRAINEDGIALNTSIVYIPEFYITGIKHKVYAQDEMLFQIANAKGNDFYYNRRHEIQNALYHHIYIGFIEHIIGDGNYGYYMPSIQVSAPGIIPIDMICQRIPTNKYAVFKYIGLHHARYANSNNLFETMKYIYSEWFPKSGYLQSAPYRFERIDEKITCDDYCEVEFYIPVS